MKKILLGLVITLLMFFLFQYQAPIMGTEEVVANLEKQLQHPPKEWEKSFSHFNVKEVSAENISLNLSPKKGFWNELTNRKQWEVNVKYNGLEATIVIDAYTGEYADLYGPLN
ncbi:hypothetical protein [Psychrobacillus sp.]|uniref:hypothetical protein n=1 Tax=Psychrobacillus sp. TaxID=1871623 RepID=UPI0028BF4DF1|nr:hypothetical protein [Psychrobacillus sp.]